MVSKIVLCIGEYKLISHFPKNIYNINFDLATLSKNA